MHGRALAAVSLYTSSGLRKYLTSAERARFIATAKACPRREVAALCLTLAYTGCRISEALALTRASTEPEAGFVAIRSLKKRNRAVVIREVPVPMDLLNILSELAASQAGERLWTLSRSRAWQLVSAVMVEAGIAPGIHATPRGMRHTFGVHAVRSGVPVNLVQRWLGHARLETTLIYLQVMGSEEREIAAQMWQQDKVRD